MSAERTGSGNVWGVACCGAPADFRGYVVGSRERFFRCDACKRAWTEPALPAGVA